MGSGCSTVNSAVASDTSGPGFKSCQQQLLTIFTVDCLLKRQKLRKRGLDGPIKKDEKCSCFLFLFKGLITGTSAPSGNGKSNKKYFKRHIPVNKYQKSILTVKEMFKKANVFLLSSVKKQ